MSPYVVKSVPRDISRWGKKAVLTRHVSLIHTFYLLLVLFDPRITFFLFRSRLEFIRSLVLCHLAKNMFPLHLNRLYSDATVAPVSKNFNFLFSFWMKFYKMRHFENPYLPFLHCIGWIELIFDKKFVIIQFLKFLRIGNRFLQNSPFPNVI